ncbi:MAG: FliH/SctL family protein [Pirellulaceae bacterium]
MAGIIKAGREAGAAQGVQQVAFNFNDMSTAAEGYLEKIRREAAQILAKAKQEAEQLRGQAQQQGLQQAKQQAEADVTGKIRQQLAGVLPALEESVEQLKKARHEWVAQWQDKAVHLAARMAELVVRRELKSTPEITLDLVREALELASGSEHIRLRLNPADRAALGEGVEELAARLAKLGPAEIIADPQVSSGGCIVSTDFGDIDQRIEAQLARIEQELN